MNRVRLYEGKGGTKREGYVAIAFYLGEHTVLYLLSLEGEHTLIQAARKVDSGLDNSKMLSMPRVEFEEGYEYMFTLDLSVEERL